MAKNRKRLTVALTEQNYDKVVDCASYRGITINALLTNAIVDYVDTDIAARRKREAPTPSPSIGRGVGAQRPSVQRKRQSLFNVEGGEIST